MCASVCEFSMRARKAHKVDVDSVYGYDSYDDDHYDYQEVYELVDESG